MSLNPNLPVILVVVPGSGDTTDPTNHHMQIRAYAALNLRHKLTDVFTGQAQQLNLLIGHRTPRMATSEARTTLTYLLESCKSDDLDPSGYHWALDERPKSMAETVMVIGGWIKQLELQGHAVRVIILMNHMHADRTDAYIGRLLPQYRHQIHLYKVGDDIDDPAVFPMGQPAHRQRLMYHHRRENGGWLKFLLDPYDHQLNQTRMRPTRIKPLRRIPEILRTFRLLWRFSQGHYDQPTHTYTCYTTDPVPKLLSEKEINRLYEAAAFRPHHHSGTHVTTNL